MDFYSRNFFQKRLLKNKRTSRWGHAYTKADISTTFLLWIRFFNQHAHWLPASWHWHCLWKIDTNRERKELWRPWESYSIEAGLFTFTPPGRCFSCLFSFNGSVCINCHLEDTDLGCSAPTQELCQPVKTWESRGSPGHPLFIRDSTPFESFFNVHLDFF